LGHIAVKRLASIGTVLVAALVAACEAPPLDPTTSARLERLYADLPERRAIGVIQNLRYVGLYDGSSDPVWSEALAQSLNQFHYRLDGFEGRYDLSTDAGAHAFLSDASGAYIRDRLTSDFMTGDRQFVMVRPPRSGSYVDRGACVVDGGSYALDGEVVELEFRYGRDLSTITIDWNGWPGGPTIDGRGYLGEEWLGGVYTFAQQGEWTRVGFGNTNNFFLTQYMKRETYVRLQGDRMGAMLLPTGDLYAMAQSLEQCVANR
jgi:hypothetical protein